jgi:NAD(P)-dependent dehydrogenase (short-subunit alcohol dehydrogenase family)
VLAARLGHHAAPQPLRLTERARLPLPRAAAAGASPARARLTARWCGSPARRRASARCWRATWRASARGSSSRPAAATSCRRARAGGAPGGGARRGSAAALLTTAASAAARLAAAGPRAQPIPSRAPYHQAVKESCRGKYAGDILVLPLDMTAPQAELDAAAKAAGEAFGGAGIDFLVHNAGGRTGAMGAGGDAVAHDGGWDWPRGSASTSADPMLPTPLPPPPRRRQPARARRRHVARGVPQPDGAQRAGADRAHARRAARHAGAPQVWPQGGGEEAAGGAHTPHGRSRVRRVCLQLTVALLPTSPRPTRGRVVVVASMAARVASPGQSGYAAAKAAALMYFASLATEIADS